MKASKKGQLPTGPLPNDAFSETVQNDCSSPAAFSNLTAAELDLVAVAASNAALVARIEGQTHLFQYWVAQYDAALAEIARRPEKAVRP